jgi:hypothetical protein
MLTDKQRKFLIEGAEGIDAEPKSQKVRNYRRNIRERTKTALEDIELLAQQLELRDIEQILFDSKADFEYTKAEKAQDVADWSNEGVDSHKSHLNCMPAVIEFFYLGTMSTRKPFFQWLSRDGIRRAYQRQNQVVNSADVSLDLELGPKAENIDTDDLTDLSQKELNTVINSGEVSLKQLVEAREDLDMSFSQEAIDMFDSGEESS